MKIDNKYMALIVLLLLLMGGCATKPGIRDREDVNVWADKAIQSGCNNLSQVMIVSTSDSATSNVMLRVMRKSGINGSAEKQLTVMLSDSSNVSLLVLSKINNHALDVVENLIKGWEGAAPSPMLCVFAGIDSSENLRQLAQEKDFNLHIMPLEIVQMSTEGDKK